MKRMGVFCDVVVDYTANADNRTCPDPAIGTCVCCDKDVCARHGSKKGLSLSLRRAVETTTSEAEIISGGATTCYSCVSKLNSRPALFTETILPELLDRIGVATKAALAGEALKDDNDSNQSGRRNR